MKRVAADRTSQALVASATIFVALTIAYPVGSLAVRCLRAANGAWTLSGWRDLARSPFLAEAIENTLIISIVSAGCSTVLGAALGLLSARAEFPGRRLLRASALSPFLMSQTVMAIAWVLIGERQGGLMNVLCRQAGLSLSFEALSITGIILVTTLLTLPITFFVIESLALNQNPELEEVAQICGARPRQVLLRVTLPLLWPGIAACALLCFMLSNVMFSVQGVLGLSRNIWTLANLIYFTLGGYPPRVEAAAALALSLLAAGLALLWAQQKLLSRGEYHVAARRNAAPRRPLSPPMRAAAVAAVCATFVVVVLLPYGALLFRSLAPYDAQVHEGLGALARSWSLASYRSIASDSATRRALLNSLWLSATASGLCILLAFVIGYYTERTRSSFGGLLAAVCLAPFAFSGMVLGIAFILAFSGGLVPVYGTLTALLLAYAVRELAVGFKMVQASLAQIEPELEDIAFVCGSDRLHMVRKVLWPLMAPALQSIAALAFVASFREIEASVLLASPGREVYGYQLFSGFQNGTWSDISALGLVGAAVCGAVCGLVFLSARRTAMTAEGDGGHQA